MNEDAIIRMLPNDVEAEQAVLGSMIIDKDEVKRSKHGFYILARLHLLCRVHLIRLDNVQQTDSP